MMLELFSKNCEITNFIIDEEYDQYESAEVEIKCGNDEFFCIDDKRVIPQNSVGLRADITFGIFLYDEAEDIQIIQNGNRKIGIKIWSDNKYCARRLSFIGYNAHSPTCATEHYQSNNNTITINSTFRNFIAKKSGIKSRSDLYSLGEHLLFIPNFYLKPIKAEWKYEFSQEEQNNLNLDDLNINIRFSVGKIQSVKPIKLDNFKVTSKVIEIKSDDGEYFFVDEDYAVPQQSIDFLCIVEATIKFLPGKKDIKVIKNKDIDIGIHIEELSTYIRSHTLTARFIQSFEEEHGRSHIFSINTINNIYHSNLVIRGNISTFNNGKEEFEEGDILVISSCLIIPKSIRWPCVFTSEGNEYIL